MFTTFIELRVASPLVPSVAVPTWVAATLAAETTFVTDKFALTVVLPVTANVLLAELNTKFALSTISPPVLTNGTRVAVRSRTINEAVFACEFTVKTFDTTALFATAASFT